MLYHDCPPKLAARLITEVDFCCGDCYWRRRFFSRWQTQGVDAAYADFAAHPKHPNPQFLPRIRLIIEEIHAWRSKPFPA